MKKFMLTKLRPSMCATATIQNSLFIFRSVAASALSANAFYSKQNPLLN